MSFDRAQNGLEQGIAADPGKAGRPMEDASIGFQVPAAETLGGHIAVAVVADGLGGPGGGAEASGIAADTVKQYFTLILTTNVQNSIAGAIEAAHNAILRAQAQDATRVGMKSTLTIAVVAGDRLFVGSVGDSRAYLLRDREIRPLTSDQTWVESALKPESKTHRPRRSETGPLPAHYLGTPGAIKPDLRPVEFLWPGDIVLLCTDGLTDYVPGDEMSNILSSGNPETSSKRLIQAAIEHGAEDNITAAVIRVPGTPQPVAAPVVGTKRASRWSLSRSARALILLNLLLLCLIELLIARSTGAINLLSPSTPPVEVAKPMFVVTPTAGLDEPLSATDPTQAASTLVPSPTAPAAAPSLTPVPTFTPHPAPPGWVGPAALILRSPANGLLFGGADANVILSWESAGQMPDDVFYVVVIRKYVGGRLVGESHNWTKATRIKLDSSFYTSANMSNAPSTSIGSGGGAQSNAAPKLQAATAQFQWYVQLERLTLINPDGSLQGTQISPASRTAYFLWGPYIPPTPTQIYGSDALETDPFMMDQQQRQATADRMVFPVSAGMAGLTLSLGLYSSWPKLRRRWPLGLSSRFRKKGH